MKKILFAALAAVMLSSCGSKPAVTGAGATFPLPFYNLIFSKYSDTSNVDVVYGGIGSGGGISSLKDRIVAFAGSDAYLSDEEMSSMPAEVIHIPSCMGAVVMAYNIPGVDRDINLTGEIVSDIYRGKITKWNDSSIVSVNPGVSMPDLNIIPVYRSDGSGTTFVFSYYLSQVSNEWANEIGSGKSLKWPVGIAAKGNPGVAGVLAETPGSIGYIGSEYAFALDINVASMRNRSGNFVKPTVESISASATDSIPSDMRVMITNSGAENAYPISCLTWLLIYKEQAYDGRSIEDARHLRDLILFVTGPDAQNLAEKVHYAPLPQSVVALSRKALSEMTYNGNKF